MNPIKPVKAYVELITIQRRCEELNKICRLKIIGRKEKGQLVFQFFKDDKDIKTVFTYQKAKLFAEGYKLGAKLCL